MIIEYLVNDESATVEETKVVKLVVGLMMFVLGDHRTREQPGGPPYARASVKLNMLRVVIRPLSFKSNQSSSQNHNDKAHKLTT